MAFMRLGAVLVAVGLWVSAAFAQDFHLQLDRVEADPTSVQFPTVAEGTVISADIYYGVWTTTHSWSALPEVIGPEGTTITLTAAGDPPGSNLYPGTAIHAPGFVATPDPAQVFADLRLGQTSNTVTVTLVPDRSRLGDEAMIQIGAAFGAGVRYFYRVVDGPMPPQDGEEGEEGEDDDIAGEDDDPVLSAFVECERDTIRISAQPSTSCTIHISGWSYSANPVQVLLPAVVDGWGNQANGLQSVLNGAFNAQDATNWTRPEYLWALPVFACPSQDITGSNCESFVTLPGAVSMPIIVRQEGQVDVNLMLTLNAIPHDDDATQTGVMNGGLLRFGNVWRVGEFLHIESGTPQVGQIRADWLSAVWNVVPAGDNFVRLESRWKPGAFLHAERGRLEAGEINLAWWSAQWLVEPVEGTGFVRLVNRWTGAYLHAEQGFLDLGPVEPDWASAWWWVLQ